MAQAADAAPSMAMAQQMVRPVNSSGIPFFGLREISEFFIWFQFVLSSWSTQNSWMFDGFPRVSDSFEEISCCDFSPGVDGAQFQQHFPLSRRKDHCKRHWDVFRRPCDFVPERFRIFCWPESQRYTKVLHHEIMTYSCTDTYMHWHAQIIYIYLHAK